MAALGREGPCFQLAPFTLSLLENPCTVPGHEMVSFYSFFSFSYFTGDYVMDALYT